MVKLYDDKKYNFHEIFNTKTGTYIRSGIIDKDGIDTNVDPFMRSFPSLIDIGIMGSCLHGKSGLCEKAGIQCYQDGPHSNKPNMTLDNFKKIINEGRRKGLFSVALGGAGDPDMHENFEEIVRYAAENHVVPNFTTSGLGMTKEKAEICKRYCGAVAVSWYRSKYTLNAIQLLLAANVKTNIHYVLANNTIDEAVTRLKNNEFPKDINAVVFLLHKPIGLGQKDNVLKQDDPQLKEFFDVISTNKFSFKIGFDSCSVPAIINMATNILSESIDSCEGARFSCYITPDMKALPCSFDNQDLKWAYDIAHDSIQNAWDSDIFNEFRDHFIKSCPNCPNKTSCYGGCPICREITICNKETKCCI